MILVTQDVGQHRESVAFLDQTHRNAGNVRLQRHAGITALQMDIKIQGITKEIMQVALAQAKEARLHILAKMVEAVGGAKTEVSMFAPRLYTMKINPEKIRDVIGKGGSTIRALTEETGCTIDIGEDGTITIASTDADKAEHAKKRIAEITAEVEVGKIYEGPIVKDRKSVV